jgi:hypothetical protein
MNPLATERMSCGSFYHKRRNVLSRVAGRALKQKEGITSFLPAEMELQNFLSSSIQQ